MGSGAGRKAPSDKSERKQRRIGITSFRWPSTKRGKRKRRKAGKRLWKAKTHNPTFSYSESGPIHAWLWMLRARSDCTTIPVISTQRYCRIGFCQIQSGQDCMAQTRKGTLARLLSCLMAHVYIGFHQRSHYQTPENAPVDRYNACRTHSALNTVRWTMFRTDEWEKRTCTPLCKSQ